MEGRRMNRIAHRQSLVIGLALLLAGISSVVYAQKTTLTVQASGPGKQISPDLVGVFFEDLNYAADGGLYAELIQNRSFEYSPVEQPDWNPLKCWDLQKRGGGDGSVTVAEMRPIHENNPHYALLTVRNPGEGVGIVNGGFDGIPLRAGATTANPCRSPSAWRPGAAKCSLKPLCRCWAASGGG